MKHLQSFNESIVEDKMRYLRDICNDFFDDYDGFNFEIVKGMIFHYWSAIIEEDIWYQKERS